MIYSLQVERHVLSGLLKYQDLFADIDVFLSENDFFNDVHSAIYSVFKNIKYKGEYNNTNKVDIIISNHINTVDFCIYLSIIRQFDSRDIYFILKKGVLFIPGFGSILTNSNDIKLNKKIEDDISNLENSIKNIKD